MSGVAAVRFLLANNAPLVAVVPAAKIMAGVVPLNTVLPAVSVMEVSGVPRNTVEQGEPKKFITERVQVSVLAKTNPEQKSILALVRAALPTSRGTVNGVAVDGILPDMEGPDFYDDSLVIHAGSQDFFVRFTR